MRLSDEEVKEGFHPYPPAPAYRVHRDGRILGIKNNRVLQQGHGGSAYSLVSIAGRQVPAGTVVCETFHGPRPSPSHVVIYKNGPGRHAEHEVRWGTRKEAKRRRSNDKSD